MSEQPNLQTDTSQAYMLGEINAKVTQLIISLEKHGKHTDDRLNSHGERITALERGHWKIIGIASVIPTSLAIIGLVLTLIDKV